MAYAFDNMLEEANYLKTLPYDTLVKILAKGNKEDGSFYRLFNVAAAAAEQKEAQDAFAAEQARKQTSQQAGSVVERMVTGQREPSSQGSFAQNRPMSLGVPNVQSEIAALPSPQPQPMAVAARGGYAGNLPTVRMQGDPRDWSPMTPEDRIRVAKMAAKGGLPRGDRYGMGGTLSGYDATQEGIVAAMAAKARRARTLAALGQPLVGPYASGGSPYGSGARFVKEYDIASNGGYVNNLPTVRMQDPMWVPRTEPGFTEVQPSVDTPAGPPSAGALRRGYSQLYGMLSQAVLAAGDTPVREELRGAQDALREGRELFLENPTALSEYIDYWGPRAQSIVSPPVATTQLPPDVTGGTVALEPPRPPLMETGAPASLVPEVYDERFQVDAPITREQAALRRAQMIAAQNAAAEQAAVVTQAAAGVPEAVIDPLPAGKIDFTSDIRKQAALLEELGQPVTGPPQGDLPPPEEGVPEWLKERRVTAPRVVAEEAGVVDEREELGRSGILSRGTDLAGNVVSGGIDAVAEFGADAVEAMKQVGSNLSIPFRDLANYVRSWDDVPPPQELVKRLMKEIQGSDIPGDVRGSRAGYLPGQYPHFGRRFDDVGSEDEWTSVITGDSADAAPITVAPPDASQVAPTVVAEDTDGTPVSGDGEAAVDVAPPAPIAKEDKRAQKSAAELFALHPDLQRTLEGGDEAGRKIAALLAVRGDPTTGVRMPEFVLSEEPVSVEKIQKDVLSVNDLAKAFPIGSSLDITGIETSIAESKKYATEKLEELAVKMDEYASSKPSKSTNDIIKRYQDRLDALRSDPLPFFRAAAAVMKGRQEGLVPFISAMTGFSEGNEELKKQMLPLIDKMTEIELANAEIEAAKKATILKMNGELRQAMIAARQGDTANEINLLKVVQQDKNSMLTFQAALDRNAITAKGYMMQYLGTDAALMDRLQETMQASGDPVANGLMFDAGRDEAGRQILRPTMLGWEWITKTVRDTKSTSGAFTGATFSLGLDTRAAKVTDALEKNFKEGSAASRLWDNTEFRQWATEQGYNMGDAFSRTNEYEDEIKNAMMTWWMVKGTGPTSAKMFANNPMHKERVTQILELWAPSGRGSPTGSLSDFDRDK